MNSSCCKSFWITKFFLKNDICDEALFAKSIYLLYWYVVLEGTVCTVFFFWVWQKATSSVYYLDLIEWKETVFWVSSPPSTTFQNFCHYKSTVLQLSCNVTGLARFVTTFYLDFWQEWTLERCWISLQISGYHSPRTLAIFNNNLT